MGDSEADFLGFLELGVWSDVDIFLTGSGQSNYSGKDDGNSEGRKTARWTEQEARGEEKEKD